MISREELKILKSFAERIAPGDPGAHNNLAIVYYNKSLYDEAIRELEEALKIDPNFVLARNNLDIILKKTGRLEERVERLARIITKEPYDEKKTLELAYTYRKLNRYSQAIIFYRKVLDYNPGSFEAHYGLGITLRLLGKYDDALEEIKKALEIKISPEVYRSLGEVYFNKGVIDLAIKNFEEAITLDSSSAESHFLLGFAFGEKGKIDESLEAVKKAIALNPALAQFEPNLPIDIKEHKTHWEFLKEQLGIPKISENEYQVHFNLGMTYRNKGLFGEARREFDECLKLQADNPDLLLAIGEVCLYLNKLSDAVEHLERAYESDFDSVRCTNALGVTYCMRSDFSQAIEWFQKALALKKDFVPAVNNLGVCQFNQGNVDDAVKYYERAIDAGSADANFNLGMYYLNKGNHDNALKLFSGTGADEYFGKGLVYVELQKDNEALEFFKKALSVVPNHAGAYYNIGFIYTKIGKFKEGLSYIKKGIESEANYDKDKFRLSLDPELSEFGLYYAVSAGKSVETETAEENAVEVDAGHYLISAENYFNRNDFKNALSMVDKVLDLEPDSDKATVLKAKILFETNNIDDAIGFLDAYVKNHPEDKDVKATLGDMLKEVGHLDRAKEIYLDLLKQEESNIEWLNDVAEISYQTEKLDEALSFYQRIYGINEEDIAANLGFSKIYIKHKDFDKAKPYLDFFRNKHPDIYDFNVLTGIYHLEKNEHEDAIRYFEKAIEIDSSKALPYYHLGVLQVQKGDFETACDSWKKALLLSPTEDLAKKVRHCLKITVELAEFLKKEA